MVKIRENAVFILSDVIASAEYVHGSLTATKGQPTQEPVKVDVTDGVVTIQVMSGRKKSKPIADEFKRKSSAFFLTTQGGGGEGPQELNFMFSLKLRFNDGQEVIAHLGQGSRMGVRNNWWIGSNKNIKAVPSSLKNEGFNVGDALKGIVPAKWSGLVSVIDNVLLKDLTQEVNVFKIG